MASALDWTVDQLLSGVKTVDARLESARNTLRSNRARYMSTLRSLPEIRDVASRDKIRAELGKWIPKQVAAENRVNDLLATLAAAKAKAKTFLKGVGISPPAYLGFAPVLVPAAIWGTIALLLTAGTVVVTLAITHSKGLGVIESVAATARARNWSAQETATALDAARRALDAARPDDPLGIEGVLKAALPILVIGAIIVFAGPMLKRKFA